MHPFCRNIYQKYSALIEEKKSLDREFKNSHTPDTRNFILKYKEMKRKSFEFLSFLYFEHSRGTTEKLINQIDDPLKRKTTLNSILKIAAFHLTQNQLKGYLQLNFPEDKETIDNYNYFLVAHLSGQEEKAKKILKAILLAKGELQPDHQLAGCHYW